MYTQPFVALIKFTKSNYLDDQILFIKCALFQICLDYKKLEITNWGLDSNRTETYVKQ